MAVTNIRRSQIVAVKRRQRLFQIQIREAVLCRLCKGNQITCKDIEIHKICVFHVHPPSFKGEHGAHTDWSKKKVAREGVFLYLPKFELVNPAEKCRPATWWQNNGVSDLWPAINNSCFQAPYCKQVFYESAHPTTSPSALPPLLSVAASVCSLRSWPRVKKCHRSMGDSFNHMVYTFILFGFIEFK